MAVSCIKPECTLSKRTWWRGGFVLLACASSAPSLLQWRGSSLTLFTMIFSAVQTFMTLSSGLESWSVGRSHNNTGRWHYPHQQSWTTPLLGLQTMFGVKNSWNIFIASRKEISAIMCAIILWIKNWSKLLLLLGHFCNSVTVFWKNIKILFLSVTTNVH